MRAPTEQERLDDIAQDAKIDRYHDGYFAHRKGLPRPACPDAAAGWDQRAIDCRVRVVMPRRPEGYYHCAPGTFD